MTAFALLSLASRPELQAEVAREARELWGSSSEARSVSLADLSKFELLDKVLKETARLYPVAGFTARDCLVDCEVEGLRISRGTMIMLDITAAHVHPDHWENPGVFDVSRWDEGKPAPTRGSYVPFGEGPKVCIGQTFAKTSMKVTISKLLAEFELVREVKDIKSSFTLTLTPRDDAKVILRARK
jgi:cytochrome P450